MNEKGFAPIVLIAAVGIIAGILVLLFFQNKERFLPKSSPQDQPLQTFDKRSTVVGQLDVIHTSYSNFDKPEEDTISLTTQEGVVYNIIDKGGMLADYYSHIPREEKRSKTLFKIDGDLSTDGKTIRWRSFEYLSEVMVTTDKTEYEYGETINITIRNGLTKSIWHYSPSWYLKEYENKPDFQIPTAITLEKGKEVCYPILYERWVGELKPNSEINDKWDQKFCPLGQGIGPFESGLIEQGAYRIAFIYGLDKSSSDSLTIFDPRTIYSDEFKIK